MNILRGKREAEELALGLRPNDSGSRAIGGTDGLDVDSVLTKP